MGIFICPAIIIICVGVIAFMNAKEHPGPTIFMMVLFGMSCWATTNAYPNYDVRQMLITFVFIPLVVVMILGWTIGVFVGRKTKRH